MKGVAGSVSRNILTNSKCSRANRECSEELRLFQITLVFTAALETKSVTYRDSPSFLLKINYGEQHLKYKKIK